MVQVIGELLGNVPKKLNGLGQGAASIPQAQGTVHSLQDRQPRKVTPLRGAEGAWERRAMGNMGNTEKLLRQKDHNETHITIYGEKRINFCERGQERTRNKSQEERAGRWLSKESRKLLSLPA